MSLLPRSGVCYSCGHDHGPMGGLPPDTARVLEAHAMDLRWRDARITELERRNAELRKIVDAANAVTIWADPRGCLIGHDKSNEAVMELRSLLTTYTPTAAPQQQSGKKEGSK